MTLKKMWPAAFVHEEGKRAGNDPARQQIKSDNNPHADVSQVIVAYSLSADCIVVQVHRGRACNG